MPEKVTSEKSADVSINPTDFQSRYTDVLAKIKDASKDQDTAKKLNINMLNPDKIMQYLIDQKDPANKSTDAVVKGVAKKQYDEFLDAFNTFYMKKYGNNALDKTSTKDLTTKELSSLKKHVDIDPKVAELNSQRTKTIAQLKDKKIVDLQNALNLHLPLDKQLPPTGYFGTQTRDAIISFQNSNNLEPVGYVGPGTYKLLFPVAPPVTTPSNQTETPNVSLAPAQSAQESSTSSVSSIASSNSSSSVSSASSSQANVVLSSSSSSSFSNSSSAPSSAPTSSVGSSASSVVSSAISSSSSSAPSSVSLNSVSSAPASSAASSVVSSAQNLSSSVESKIEQVKRLKHQNDVSGIVNLLAETGKKLPGVTYINGADGNIDYISQAAKDGNSFIFDKPSNGVRYVYAVDSSNQVLGVMQVYATRNTNVYIFGKSFDITFNPSINLIGKNK